MFSKRKLYLQSHIVDAHFDKRAQWEKKPNNMKKIGRENRKIKTSRPEW